PLEPPRAPGEALISVATLLRKATNDGSPGAGRDTQSMAFFSTAVLEQGGCVVESRPRGKTPPVASTFRAKLPASAPRIETTIWSVATQSGHGLGGSDAA